MTRLRHFTNHPLADEQIEAQLDAQREGLDPRVRGAFDDARLGYAQLRGPLLEDHGPVDNPDGLGGRNIVRLVKVAERPYFPVETEGVIVLSGDVRAKGGHSPLFHWSKHGLPCVAPLPNWAETSMRSYFSRTADPGLRSRLVNVSFMVTPYIHGPTLRDFRPPQTKQEILERIALIAEFMRPFYEIDAPSVRRYEITRFDSRLDPILDRVEAARPEISRRLPKDWREKFTAMCARSAAKVLHTDVHPGNIIVEAMFSLNEDVLPRHLVLIDPFNSLPFKLLIGDPEADLAYMCVKVGMDPSLLGESLEVVRQTVPRVNGSRLAFYACVVAVAISETHRSDDWIGVAAELMTSSQSVSRRKLDEPPEYASRRWSSELPFDRTLSLPLSNVPIGPIS